MFQYVMLFRVQGFSLCFSVRFVHEEEEMYLFQNVVAMLNSLKLHSDTFWFVLI